MNNFDKLSELDQIIYTNEIAKCDGCKSFEECKQQNKGLQPIIIEPRFSSNEFLKLAYIKCSKYPGIVYSSYENAISNALPLYKNDKRDEILKELLKGNGGFLYGNAGIGKSTIMLNLAKELVGKGKNVCYELANNISVSLKEFKDNEKKMRLFQNVDILFIDDFAREVMTAWVILNIFNPILQHRIDNNMPTYITCNYSLIELFRKIEKSTDNISAVAIISRIKTIGEYHLKDKNYRLEKKYD